MNPATAQHLLDDADREYLKKLVKENGFHATAKALDVTRGVISAAVAGINVRRGSIEMLRAAIDEHRRKGPTK